MNCYVGAADNSTCYASQVWLGYTAL